MSAQWPCRIPAESVVCPVDHRSARLRILAMVFRVHGRDLLGRCRQTSQGQAQCDSSARHASGPWQLKLGSLKQCLAELTRVRASKIVSSWRMGNATGSGSRADSALVRYVASSWIPLVSSPALLQWVRFSARLPGVVARSRGPLHMQPPHHVCPLLSNTICRDIKRTKNEDT